MYESVLLTSGDNNEDLPSIEATESEDGLHLYLYARPPGCGPETDDILFAYWGCLPLDAWRTLAEMYALRHPEAFRPIVQKWEALTHARL